MSSTASIQDRLRALTPTKELLSIRAWRGPLTEELVRQPGAFGLGQVPANLAPDATTTTVCGFCSTGCGLDIGVAGNEIVGVRGRATDRVNHGRLGPKGLHAWQANASRDRLTRPLLRRNGRLE